MLAKSKTQLRVSTSVCAMLFSVLGIIGLFTLDRFPYRLSYEQGIHYQRIYSLTAVFLLGGLLCGVTALRLCYRESTRFMKRGVWGCVFLSLIGLAIFCLDIGDSGVHSIPSALNICINNLHSLDRAKETWALHSGATNGTEVSWDRIAPDLPVGFPVCPEGGKYELGKVGEPVRCSNPKHRIPTQ